MNKVFVVGAGLVAMLAAGAAVAQSPPQGAPPPPPGEMRGPHGGGPEGEMRGPHGGPGMMQAMHEMHHRESKAAHFRFRKGDAMVDIKCAEDEPMKACVDASASLLDKLATK